MYRSTAKGVTKVTIARVQFDIQEGCFSRPGTPPTMRPHVTFDPYDSYTMTSGSISGTCEWRPRRNFRLKSQPALVFLGFCRFTKLALVTAP